MSGYSGVTAMPLSRSEMLDLLQESGWAPEGETVEEVQQSLQAYLEKSGVGKPKEPGVGLYVKPQKQVNVLQQPPRLANFSGEKKDCAFDLWKYEVECLSVEGLHTPDSIQQAIRHSLKGEAGRIIMRLGPKASVQDILKKLEGVYGVIETKESILSEFYSAHQGEEEDVASWGCRLEDLLGRAKQQGLKLDEGQEEMLRAKFWSGLNQRLKDSARYKFEATTSFEDLRREVRLIELEYKGSDTTERTDPDRTGKPSKGQARAAIERKQKKEDDEPDLAQKFESFLKEFRALKKQVGEEGKMGVPQNRLRPQIERDQGLMPPSRECWYCHQPGHTKYNCPALECWRCKQHGHMQRDCKVITDHTRQHFRDQSAPGGGLPAFSQSPIQSQRGQYPHSS